MFHYILLHWVEPGTEPCGSARPRNPARGALSSSCVGLPRLHGRCGCPRPAHPACCPIQKYYNSLVVGLIGLAFGNSYIVHMAYHKNKGSRPVTLKYIIKLQICQLRATMLTLSACGNLPRETRLNSHHDGPPSRHTPRNNSTNGDTSQRNRSATNPPQGLLAAMHRRQKGCHYIIHLW